MKLKIKYTSVKAEELYKNRAKKFDWKEGDSGIDLSYFDAMGRNCIIPAGGTGMIPTGVSCQLCETKNDLYEIQIRGRSGLNSKGLLTHLGTVDYNYTGELKVVVTNLTQENFTFNPGDRIAQIVVAQIAKPKIVSAEELENTDRGTNGFGSTGL